MQSDKQVQIQIEDYPLRLNSSSIASSTPGNNISITQNNFVPFQQFEQLKVQDKNKCVKNSHPIKKLLTIQIDESYDFNESVQNLQQSSDLTFPKGKQYMMKNKQKHKQKPDLCIKTDRQGIQNYQTKRSQKQVQISNGKQYEKIREQLQALKQELMTTQNQLNMKRSENQFIVKENESLKIILKKKDQACFFQRQRNLKLSERVAELQTNKQQHNFYDQKLRQKQSKIQQIIKKNQKIVNLNKMLQKQLKESQKKTLQLQKQLKKVICHNHQQAINRIKESSIKAKQSSVNLKAKQKQRESNKENNNPTVYNMLSTNSNVRKSLQKKKCTSQGKKNLAQTIKNQRTSSSSNIVSKKLLVIK